MPPRGRLERNLLGHDALTVPEMGWASTRSGELLTLAEGRFNALAVVVLQAKTDKVTHLSGANAHISGNSGTFQRNGKDFPPAGA